MTRAEAPAVAGVDQLIQASGPESTAPAELLLGELNCLSCHAASDDIRARVPTRPAPDLDNIGARIAPSYLERYLADPQSMKPGATMPNIFHASENAASDPVVDYLVHFLVARGGVMKLSHAPVDGSLLAAGEHLFHAVGCVACHPPQNGEPASEKAIPLGKLAEKIGVDPLTEFLLDPLKVRKGARMPDLGLTTGEARAIAVYLLRGQIGNKQLLKPNSPTRNGWSWELFADAKDLSANFKKLKPTAIGETARLGDAPAELKVADKNSVVLYEARLAVFEAGEKRFRLSGGAGSRLNVVGRPVARVEDGAPGEGVIPLDAGSATLEILRAGAAPVKLEWRGAYDDWTPVPGDRITIANDLVMMPLRWRGITLDAQKVKLGRQMFSALRCAACHQMEDIRPMLTAKPLDKLKVYSIVGCTGDHVKQGVPKYDFTDEQRKALKTLIRGKAGLLAPLEPQERSLRGLAKFNCLACHSRNDLGGPDTTTDAFFHTRLTEDIGDEGHLPPPLDGVGAKLRPEALRALVGGDRHRVRPYLETRMPSFGPDAPADLIEALLQLDAQPGAKPAPKFSEASAKDGLKLAGTTGLSCINCHDHKGTPGVAVPGIEFTDMSARLNHGWFDRYLRDPGVVKPGTRMPVFWPDANSAIQDVVSGDMNRQIDALWNYISQGKDMPAPERKPAQ